MHTIGLQEESKEIKTQTDKDKKQQEANKPKVIQENNQ